MHNVTRAVQDRVSHHGSGSSGTMCTGVDGQINTICTNRDHTQVVVAGRNVFKIFSVEEESFIERYNLRVGKIINLNYSASDVAWNPIEDNILASAATNGAVVTWNLNKSSISKQDVVFNNAHKRTVNKVCFHGSEAQLLLSGSQDGVMKLFDLRKKEPITTFIGLSESVRDVQFNPHQYFGFASAHENGNVQMWDLRRPDKYERQFIAHDSPVFTIDYHPEDKNWLATAGRDKTIKVWDLTPSSMPKNMNVVHTIASVSHIRWRPQRRFHIASCALLVDFNINIWDIRRPYIPFATFNEHKDVVTSIVWKSDPHIFLSGSKDQTLYQHLFRDAKRPADFVNTACIDVSVMGHVVAAYQDKLGSTSKKRLTSLFKKTPDKSDQFPVVHSTVLRFAVKGTLSEHLDTSWFVRLARQYKLSGKSIEDLCDHNAKVAAQNNRNQASQTWLMLKYLYADHPTTPLASTRTVSIMGTSDKNANTDRYRHQSVEQTRSHDKSTDESKKLNLHADSTGLSEDESGNASDSDQGALANIASGFMGNQHTEFLFGEGEMESMAFNDMDEMNVGNEDWTLPTEAFTVRHEIVDRSGSPDPLQVDSPSDVITEHESEPMNHNHSSNTDNMDSFFVAKPTAMYFPPLNCTKSVNNMLEYYSEQGDVQMTVTVLLVIGDKISSHIEEHIQEDWFLSYIELLGRFSLWSVATEVIKLSKLSNVYSLSQQSTLVNVDCSSCCKPMRRTGWVCKRCKGLSTLCSVCRMPVKGLFAWCQGCSHGGHIQHIKDWLKRNPSCPTGCGHLCEFT